MNKTVILVVEDDRPIRSLIVTALKTHDYKYLEAENGSSAILEASSHNPEIILLDEPTTYLDICYQLEVLELVRHLNRAYAMTIVMVLHDINQAAQYSDIVYMMKDGEIYNTGAPKDIFLPESFTDVFRVEMRTLTDRNNEYYVPQRMVRRREENV